MVQSSILHRVLVPGNGTALLAWMHWCFVREVAAAQILAACKEFDVPAGFPVNNPEQMEQRINEGWSLFIIQRRNAAGLAAIETGRRLSGR